MLAGSAHQHGYRVVVFTGGETGSPAGRVAEVEVATAFDDPDGVAGFLDRADVVTWEFENVDPRLAEIAELEGIPVRPAGSIIATAQDRVREKRALEDAGVPVAPWRPAGTRDELRAAVEELGAPVIAKTTRMGYDGRGQARLESVDDVADVWHRLEAGPLVVETVVDFERELSVIVARGVDGSLVDHGVMENDHADHILDTTVVPARIAPERAAEARAIARRVAEAWGLVGVLCVELFDAPGGLVVNEVAPRPHNSGHCTIEAAPASQFEQQLRAVTGLPLGDGRCRPAAMAQLLGDLWSPGEPAWPAVLALGDVHLHLYDKSDPRPGRKMGHLTCVGDAPDAALHRVIDARHALSRR
jgi:5-(carboxyamino)imidazole ribonucleotide synthase